MKVILLSLSPHLSSPISHRYNDLANLLVRFHIAVRLDDLLERESPGDDWPETPVGQPFVDEPLRFLQPSEISRDFRQLIPADRQVLGQDIEQRQRRRFSAERAIDEQYSEACHNLRQLFDSRTTNRVEHYPRPLVTGDRHNLLHQVLFVGCDYVSRSCIDQGLTF